MKLKRFLENPYRAFSVLANKGLCNWVPDKLFLKLQYRAQMGKPLNLENPKTFNEKLQWLKLYDRKPEYTMMVDKYAVKEYVAGIIGEEYIIPTLGVWDAFDEIDFDSLPNQFVLKCTHDSGGLVICRNKSKLDIQAAKRKINKALKRNYYYCGREWPYKNVKHRIIAEAYMEDSEQTDGLRDYKFYCFNGTPKFLYISQGLENHNTAKISFLNLDWTKALFCRSDYDQFDVLPHKPQNYNEMLIIAKQLSEDIPFVRVDMYEIQKKIFFSELTFSPCDGMMPFEPKEWDGKIGDLLTLPNYKED